MTIIANMHKKIGKNHACGFKDMLANRQTHTQTYSSQYFAPLKGQSKRQHKKVKQKDCVAK